MAQTTFSAHNAVAVYPDVHSAERVIASLERDGIARDSISFLSRSDEKAVSEREAYDEVSGGTERPEPDTMKGGLVQDVTKKGAAGGAAGGLAGFIGGLIGFAVPGVGPVIGVGVWASALAGAVAGSAAGGVYGGIQNMWDKRYRDAINEGRVLVGVHSDDPAVIDKAQEVLARESAERIDIFDAEGRPLA